MRIFIAILALLLTTTVHAQTKLSVAQFANPSSQYGIRCWWWWLNGNVTKDGITKDLEGMKAQGFSGACIFDAGGHNQQGNGNIPEGPMFGTPAWTALFVHAVSEAKRLNLVLSLNIQSGWNLGAPDTKPDESAKVVTWSESTLEAGATGVTLPQAKAINGLYHDIAVLAFPYRDSSTIPPLKNQRLKAAFAEIGGSAGDTRFLIENETAANDNVYGQTKDVIDISKFMGADGKLSWKVPSGKWTVMRFGYTNNGSHISTSSGKWQGLVIDYMSEKHFIRYWNSHVKPLLDKIGKDAGNTLRYVQSDSWELGGINWTEDFAAEFKKRRGYDILKYLPVVAGKILDSRDVSNRFLADLRKTVGDCISDNHYRVFNLKAREYGIGIQPESAGPHNGPFDGLKNFGHSEIMMGEFWSPSPHRPTPGNRFFVKQAASAAHIYNKPLVGAEAYTTIGRHWDDVIWEHMKPAFDHEVCSGLNLTLLHTFSSSPDEMGEPGQEYFAGTHFNRHTTWFKYSGEYFKYMARIQYMMQQGKFIADVLYYHGDHIPNVDRLKEDDPAKILPGFDYDVINEDMLMKLTVKGDRIYLPHGMNYRVLVLPDHKILSLKALEKVHELVMNGGTVMGLKTERTASLTGYPESEKEVSKISTKLWGGDAETFTARTVGKGKVLMGYEKDWKAGKSPLPAWLVDNGLAEDCAIKKEVDSTSFAYIHHILNGEDYYFISSQNKLPAKVVASFRVKNKEPELWDPVTGEIRPLHFLTQKGEVTSVPLEFDPYGSAFIVFRSPGQTKVDMNSNYHTFKDFSTLSGPWILHFDTKWGGPASVSFPELVSWTTRPEEGIKYYSGSVIYEKDFTVDATNQLQFIDLGVVKDVGIAKVKVNGKNAGVLWCPPYRVKISSLLKPGTNHLEVEVINSWRNRLVGDRGLPQEKRFTKTNVTILPTWQLLESGLLGPVKIVREE